MIIIKRFEAHQENDNMHCIEGNRLLPRAACTITYSLFCLYLAVCFFLLSKTCKVLLLKVDTQLVGNLEG